MADTLCNPSEFKFLWKQRGNPNYSLMSVASDGSFIESLAFEDVRNGRRLVGKLVASPKEGEAYHWPRLLHANLNPLLDIVSMNERVSLYLSPHVGRSLQAAVHDPAFLLDPCCFERKKAYAEDILWALDYVHGKNLCLLNLTDAAVRVCDVSDKAVLCDFSRTTLIERVCRQKMALPGLFQAPEVRTGGRFDPVRAEMWSYGVLALQVFTGHAFLGQEIEQMLAVARGIDYAAVRGANPAAPLSLLEVIELKKFLNLFLVEDPFLRETARNAALSPFLRNARLRSVVGKRGRQAGPRTSPEADKRKGLELKRQRCDLEFENLYLKEVQRCRDQMKSLPTSNKFVNLGAFAEGGDEARLGERKLLSNRRFPVKREAGSGKSDRRSVSGKAMGRADIYGNNRLEDNLTSLEKDFLLSNKPVRFCKRLGTPEGESAESSPTSRHNVAISKVEAPIFERYESQCPGKKNRDSGTDSKEIRLDVFQSTPNCNSEMPSEDVSSLVQCGSLWTEKIDGGLDSKERQADILESFPNSSFNSSAFLNQGEEIPYHVQQCSDKKSEDPCMDFKVAEADMFGRSQISKDNVDLSYREAFNYTRCSSGWLENDSSMDSIEKKADSLRKTSGMFSSTSETAAVEESRQSPDELDVFTDEQKGCITKVLEQSCLVYPSDTSVVPLATDLSEDPANDTSTTLREETNGFYQHQKDDDKKDSPQELCHQQKELKLPGCHDSECLDMKELDQERQIRIRQAKALPIEVENYQNVCYESNMSIEETQSFQRNESSQNASRIPVTLKDALTFDQDLDLDQNKLEKLTDELFNDDSSFPNLCEINFDIRECKVTGETMGDTLERDSINELDYVKKEFESLTTSNAIEPKTQERFENGDSTQETIEDKTSDGYKALTDQEMLFIEALDATYITKKYLDEKNIEKPVQNDEMDNEASKGNFSVGENSYPTKEEDSSAGNDRICKTLRKISEKYECLAEDETVGKNKECMKTLEAYCETKKEECLRKETPDDIKNDTVQKKISEDYSILQKHKLSNIVEHIKTINERESELMHEVNKVESKTGDLEQDNSRLSKSFGVSQYEGAEQNEINKKDFKKSHGKVQAYFKRISSFRKQNKKNSLGRSVSTNNFSKSNDKPSEAWLKSKSTKDLTSNLAKDQTTNVEKKHKMLRGILKNKWPLFSCFQIIHEAKDTNVCLDETKEQND